MIYYSQAVDLLTSNYHKSYESDIENLVDRAYQICKLENKKDRATLLQWAMKGKVEPKKLDELVAMCNKYQHLPANEIIKLNSRTNFLVANLEHLNTDFDDRKLAPIIIKMYNSTDIHMLSQIIYGKKDRRQAISTILAHAYEVQPHLKSQQIFELIETLESKTQEELELLAARYKSGELHANVEVLNKALSNGNVALLDTDPHGKRDPKGLKDQFDTETVIEKINQLKLISSTKKDQRIEETILLDQKKELLEDFLAINKFGEEHVRHLDRGQLQTLAQDYRDILQSETAGPAEKKQAMLGYMAVSREGMYRVSGKFANSTQMLAIINNFRAGTHVVNEVQTGQGKSIISAISASVLAASGYSVDVTTSNIDLAKRDIEENGKFFDYVGTKYSKDPISQTSSKKQYSVGGINYSTIPDLSLYKQNMSFEAGVEETKTALVADEFDAAANMTTVMRLAKPKELLDKATDSQYKIVYEAINSFVDGHKRDCQTKNIGELVGMMQDAIKGDHYDNFGLNSQAERDSFVKQMAKYIGPDGNSSEKLGELLAASYQASTLQEGKDFRVVSQEVQTKDGLVKISVAKVLADSVITDNVYSGGIHQCLHARLEKQRTSNPVGSPDKFVINAESEVVSSQTVKNFIDSYDRLNGYTGTYGYDVELSGYSKDIQAFQVPKHQKHSRKDLEPQFAKDKAEHLNKVNKFLDKLPGDVSSRQPVLIVCENDEEARAMYEAISKSRPNDPLQMVDSIKKDIDPETRFAGQKGMITIATPRMSRGTDINPDHQDGLCVVTAYADFRRVEGQVQGRAGRQAAKGLTVQILDENDLKAKLTSATGQRITDSGKKLLKRYHHHLEQENLTSVQGKQLEGDLRQAFILLKQSEPGANHASKKENYKKWNKEFSDTWKDLSTKFSGDREKIKADLFAGNPGLEGKLNKVQEAKANRSMLAYEQHLTSTQKSKEAMLQSGDLIAASKASNGKADRLIPSAKTVDSPNQTSLGFWKRKVDKHTLSDLSADARSFLKESTTQSIGPIKEHILFSIKEYQQDKSLSTSRKESVAKLIEDIEKAPTIQDVYTKIKEAEASAIATDLKQLNPFLNKHGSRYQQVLDNALDKIVAVTGNHKADNALTDITSLLDRVPKNNRVKKDLTELLSLKTEDHDDKYSKIKLIKGLLLQNMKNYNNTDKVLAENIIHNIERVDLSVTRAEKKPARLANPQQQLRDGGMAR
jgi:hypothetical protein